MEKVFYAKATKDLTSDNGVLDFFKGKIYQITNPGVKLTENTIVIDAQGEEHALGIWLKYFKAAL